MARPCSVCVHPQLNEINQELLQNKETYVSLGANFSLSPAMLRKHHKNHLTSQMLRSARAVEVVNSDVLLDQVQELQRRAIKILDKAERSGDLRGGTMAIREATRTLTLQARLLGELVEQTRVNVLVVTPEWAATRARILQALKDHPTARAAVLQAIGEYSTEEPTPRLPEPQPPRLNKEAEQYSQGCYDLIRD